LDHKIKIIILGAGGQLGQSLKFVASKPKYQQIFEYYFQDRASLDITDVEALRHMISTIDPAFIINAAAYTAVDKAESEPNLAEKTNVKACHNLVDAIGKQNIKVVHISSDYVYHSYNGFPQKECSPTVPIGIYATTKLQGEEVFRNSSVSTLILRTSWVVSPFGNNFIKTMLRLGSEKSELNVVNDQYGSPTSAIDLSETILKIITKSADMKDFDRKFNDTYNYSPEGISTWCDIARLVMREANLPCIIHGIPTCDYPTPAARPQWSILSKTKIKTAFDIIVPHWLKSTKILIQQLRSNS